MKKYSFLLLLIICTSCSVLKISGPSQEQNWNADAIIQRVYAKEEAKRQKEFNERITSVKNDTLAITAPF